MGTSSLALKVRLAEMAARQGGFFTAKQAVACGYQDAVHAYHVRNGDWLKFYRGIYRLAAQPRPAWPELIGWSLWSRNRAGEPQGVFCRRTALAVHGLWEEPEPLIEMAVGPEFRKNCPTPPELQIVRMDLRAEEIEQRHGFRVTTLERTLRDLDYRRTEPARGQPGRIGAGFID